MPRRWAGHQLVHHVGGGRVDHVCLVLWRRRISEPSECSSRDRLPGSDGTHSPALSVLQALLLAITNGGILHLMGSPHENCWSAGMITSPLDLTPAPQWSGDLRFLARPQPQSPITRLEGCASTCGSVFPGPVAMRARSRTDSQSQPGSRIWDSRWPWPGRPRMGVKLGDQAGGHLACPFALTVRSNGGRCAPTRLRQRVCGGARSSWDSCAGGRRSRATTAPER
jgi:hypothetical protein